MGIFRNPIAPQTRTASRSSKKKNERTNEEFLSKMMTIKRGFWCLCVSALLAGAMCQEGARRKVLDMHEAVVDEATDAMLNATMNATVGNATEEDHDHEGEDHEGEESTDDAGTDGGEESEDDSRRKLLDMHEAMEEATDAMMNATMNATDAMMNGTMNGTMMNGTEEEDHDHDHEGEDHEGEESTDDAGTDGGEESEDDSRRMLRKLAMA